MQEKRRWDRFQQEQYKNVLETRIESVLTDCGSLNLLLVNEFTRPVQKLNETLYDTDEANFADNYNFNIYVVYGKRLLNYSNALTQQSAVRLSPSIFGELDLFNQRLLQSFHALRQAEQYEQIRLLHLDLEELERDNF